MSGIKGKKEKLSEFWREAMKNGLKEKEKEKGGEIEKHKEKEKEKGGEIEKKSKDNEREEKEKLFLSGVKGKKEKLREFWRTAMEDGLKEKEGGGVFFL